MRNRSFSVEKQTFVMASISADTFLPTRDWLIVVFQRHIIFSSFSQKPAIGYALLQLVQLCLAWIVEFFGKVGISVGGNGG